MIKTIKIPTWAENNKEMRDYYMYRQLVADDIIDDHEILAQYFQKKYPRDFYWMKIYQGVTCADD
jgi:hypothetical protein